MTELSRVVAAHPLRERPYSLLEFTRVDGQGTALYVVGSDPKESGAGEALRRAFEQHGAHCFHCKKWLPPQKLSQQCNRDHVRAKKEGGRDHLHNLVLACGECNRRKGASDIVAFKAECGAEYLAAMERHLTLCISKLKDL
jgi:hypothetical protein